LILPTVQEEEVEEPETRAQKEAPEANMAEAAEEAQLVLLRVIAKAPAE